MPLLRFSLLVAITALLATRASAEDAPKPVRIATGVSGHIHPAACVTKAGTVLVIFSQSNYKDLRLTRSPDGGKTWTEPAAFALTAKLEIYPSSLTALRDGRVIHAWNTWYTDAKGKKSRYVQFSISTDDGKTWGEPKSLPKNPDAESVIRHAVLELAEDQWLFPLMDRTLVYNPKTEAVSDFGDGTKHGLVPIVRTPKGTLVSGDAKRSTDGGKKWEKIDKFPEIAKQGWRLAVRPDGTRQRLPDRERSAGRGRGREQVAVRRVSRRWQDVGLRRGGGVLQPRPRDRRPRLPAHGAA